jgi:hypothetical protein
MFTFRYNEVEMEEHTLLRNFMEINLANVTQRKYLNLDRNPFAEEDQEKYNCEYTLKSLVSFEDKQSSDSCFLTYVKKDDQTWIKYSRTTRTEVSRKEVEAIVHPYVLVYEKVWTPEKDRLEIISQAEADQTDPDKHTM